MYELFLDYLYGKIEKDIQKNKKDNDNIQYKAKLISSENIYGEYHCTLEIIGSSKAGKLDENLKVEEKLRVEGVNKSYIGTLMSVEKNNIFVVLQHKLCVGVYTITRLTNFNNKILKNELKSLKPSKEVDEYVITNFITSILSRLEVILRDHRLKGGHKEFVVLYIVLLGEIHNTDPNCLLDNFLKNNDSVAYLRDQNITIDMNPCNDLHKSKILDTIDRVYDYHIDNLSVDSHFDIEKELLSISLEPKNLKFFSKSLNDSQKAAVKSVEHNVNFKIIGPPGTGKTSTIIEIISQLLSTRSKILVCGPSNISIDNIIVKYLESNFYAKTPIKFYRRGSSIKGLCQYNLKSLVDEYTKFFTKEKDEKDFARSLMKLKRLYREKIESETRLVFSTTFSAISEYYDFDWVIIDEACQSSVVESYLPIRHGRNFILVGDPNQLCHESKSLYELLSLKTHLLDTQYRMCHRLMSFSNTSFYKNQIKSFRKESFNIIENSPIVFVDTKTIDAIESTVDTSKANLKEAELVVKLVSLIKSKDIGIITPYSAQVQLLTRLLPNLEVATVDGFQGREKEYIIISLVRSNADNNFGFLDNFKRLNVALTRCKKGLIVVGNSDCFRKCDVVNNFIKFVEKHFVSIDPMEIDDYLEESHECV